MPGSEARARPAPRLRPRSGPLRERLSREGDTPGARLALQRWLTGYSTVLLMLVVALWDMIFKPTL
jgi:hypothetical protein